MVWINIAVVRPYNLGNLSLEVGYFSMSLRIYLTHLDEIW